MQPVLQGEQVFLSQINLSSYQQLFTSSVMLLIYRSEFCSPCLIIIWDCVVWNVGVLPVHWLKSRLRQFTLCHVLLHCDHLHLVLSFNLLYLLLQNLIFLMHIREVLLCYGDKTYWIRFKHHTLKTQYSYQHNMHLFHV